jgi:hypothetical protein
MSDTKFKQKANEYLSKPACQRGGDHEWVGKYTFMSVIIGCISPAVVGRRDRLKKRVCKHCDAVPSL